jgi:hypothetical protein
MNKRHHNRLMRHAARRPSPLDRREEINPMCCAPLISKNS